MNKKNTIKIISIVLIAAVVIVFALFGYFSFRKKDTAQIIIVAGQSNAEGVCLYQDLNGVLSEQRYSQFEKGVSKIQYLSRQKNKNFQTYRFGLNENKDVFGIDLGIVDYYLDLETKPTGDIFIVKCAVGGTALKEFWQPGNTGYETLKTTTDKAITLLKKSYKNIKLSAMCWMQGESDSGVLELSENYAENLDSFVGKFRADFKDNGAETMTFVDTFLAEDTTFTYPSLVNQQKAQYAASHENSVCFDSNLLSLTHIPDGIHYDAESMLALGHEFGKHVFTK